MSKISKVGFGGSCHWCTEAVFQSLIGVDLVEQGWIASAKPHENFSEAVIVHFEPDQIDLNTLINIHLHTHSCTGKHSMRSKYRSAIYTFSFLQQKQAEKILRSLQQEFEDKIITEVLEFKGFRLNQENYLNYYYSNPEKPFCQNYITPKLKTLFNKFSSTINEVSTRYNER